MSKLADEEEATDGTNTFQREKSAAVDIEPVTNNQETGLFGAVATPVKFASRPASVPLENSPLEQDSSPQASKPTPIPVPPPPVPPPIPQPQPSPPAAPSSPRAPSYLSMEPEGQTSLEPAHRKPPAIPEPFSESLPRRKPPTPEAFSLPFIQPAASDLSSETVRRKAPVAEPYVIPVSEVSPTHDFAQVLANLSEPDRPVSAHIYENADTWLTSLIANSRSRGQTEIQDPSPADPFYAVPHPRKDSKQLIPVVDSTSDYVPMTPCNRSHSLRQM